MKEPDQQFSAVAEALRRAAQQSPDSIVAQTLEQQRQQEEERQRAFDDLDHKLKILGRDFFAAELLPYTPLYPLTQSHDRETLVGRWKSEIEEPLKQQPQERQVQLIGDMAASMKITEAGVDFRYETRVISEGNDPRVMTPRNYLMWAFAMLNFSTKIESDAFSQFMIARGNREGKDFSVTCRQIVDWLNRPSAK